MENTNAKLKSQFESQINLTARLAVPEDVEQIVKIQRVAVEKSWRPYIKSDFDVFLENRFNPALQLKKYQERILNPSDILCVIEDEGKVIGFASLKPKNPEDQPKGFEYKASAFYIAPEYDGTGAKNMLLFGLMTELDKRNARKVFAWCMADNEQARGFLEKIGGTLIESAIPPKEYSDAAPHVAYGWEL